MIQARPGHVLGISERPKSFASGCHCRLLISAIRQPRTGPRPLLLMRPVCRVSQQPQNAPRRPFTHASLFAYPAGWA